MIKNAPYIKKGQNNLSFREHPRTGRMDKHARSNLIYRNRFSFKKISEAVPHYAMSIEAPSRFSLFN
jgi:hypothetical protein